MIAVFHIKFISSILKIYDLPYLNTYKEIYHNSLTSSLARHLELLSFFKVKSIH